MSEKPRAVTPDLFAYLAARTIREDKLLRDLHAAAAAEGIPAISVSPEQGAFLEILALAAGVRRVVEVGTLAGATAIRFARIGATVNTIEVVPKHAAFARAWAARAGVAHKVEVHEGDARKVLATFPSSSADLAFIDADKENYAHYLRECVRIVRVGGLVLADNAFAFGQLLDAEDQDPEVVAIREFNDRYAAAPELRGIIVPFGDGCWVGVKVQEPPRSGRATSL